TIRNAEATAQLRQALEGLPVKSLFDFIGRTEASRGVRSRSWTFRNAEATAQLRQALEGLPVKSLFDFIGRTEASRGVRSRSWTSDSSCSK
ncbi:hypothetical protein DYI25_22360, partial [Mesobacillus boroniphilus]|nr:hypothetical protein [Mesobacillus boroniphilus]